MRFLCVYRAEERTEPPSQEEMAAMGGLIAEMTQAGVLLATEGCMPSQHGFRMRVDHGKYTTTDGPFAETKELICGFCLIQCKNREEAEHWTKRFLSVVGRGSSEVRPIWDGPA